MACSYLNDLIAYYNSQCSPVYVCSLDAEKCFDKIWHDGLFFKLLQYRTLPAEHWAFLLRWYRCSSVAVRWNDELSNAFHPSRGTKQGSLLSPMLFNVYVNELLLQLQSSPQGLRIGGQVHNSLAYADDLTLFSSAPQDLQTLIDKCTDYADRWRFTYSFKKTKCLIAGKCPLLLQPRWTLKGAAVETCDSITVLGVDFMSTADCHTHPELRTSACRRAFFSFADRGILYPGLCSEAKVHLWKTIALPTLTYAMESVSYPDRAMEEVEACQSSLIKRSFGLPNRSHHSHLLSALDIHPVSQSVDSKTVNLFSRVFKTNSPARSLNIFLLSHFMLSNKITKGTLLHRLLRTGSSPVKTIVTKKPKLCHPHPPRDGFIDSLEYLLLHENYVKPWSSEFILTTLFTKCF
jgi:hypothetical protein